MSVSVGRLHLKVADFIGQVHFQWYSENEVGNIDIPVLWRLCLLRTVSHHIALSVNNSPCGSYVVSCPLQDTSCVGVSSNMLQMVSNVTYDLFAGVEPIHEEFLMNSIRIFHHGYMMFLHWHWEFFYHTSYIGPHLQKKYITHFY